MFAPRAISIWQRAQSPSGFASDGRADSWCIPQPTSSVPPPALWDRLPRVPGASHDLPVRCLPTGGAAPMRHLVSAVEHRRPVLLHTRGRGKGSDQRRQRGKGPRRSPAHRVNHQRPRSARKAPADSAAHRDLRQLLRKGEGWRDDQNGEHHHAHGNKQQHPHAISPRHVAYAASMRIRSEPSSVHARSALTGGRPTRARGGDGPRSVSRWASAIATAVVRLQQPPASCWGMSGPSVHGRTAGASGRFIEPNDPMLPTAADWSARVPPEGDCGAANVLPFGANEAPENE